MMQKTPIRAIHPGFNNHLEAFDPILIELFIDVRNYLLELYPA